MRQGRLLIAEPFFGPGDRWVLGRGGAEEGRLVLVVPQSGPGGAVRIEAELGDPEVTRDVLAALMLERDCVPAHHPNVEDAAAHAVAAADPAPERVDLTDVPTFTIDPATAKDFDDAISAEALPDGTQLIRVHIADVTSYVAEGSAIDRAAEARATSTYIPGFVAPMLPPQLADDACSLVPGLARRAVTVELIVDGGRCSGAEVYRSLIRSDARLTYDEVDEVFAGAREAQDPWAAPLAVARSAAADLAARRVRALELDVPEPEFSFAPDGTVQDQRQEEHTESHRLIEMLMVLANEQVAKILDDAGAPGLFRIHEQPDPSAAERLAGQLEALGIVPPPIPDQLSPDAAADVVVACSKLVGRAVRAAGRGHLALPLLILRALKVASYSPSDLGHAGLGLDHYCHFTSPIRRYPDVVCHRAVLELAERGAARSGQPHRGRHRADGATGEERPVGAVRAVDVEALAELARHCSDEERAAMALEREADRIARAFLLRQRLRDGGWEQEWTGEVTGLATAGLFVSFGGGFEGFVPLRTLRGDWWELGDEGTTLHGESSGSVLRLGDPATVVVERVDEVLGRVDLRAVSIGGGRTAS